MQINNSTNKELSLYHDTLYLLGIDRSDTTELPFVDFIRSANEWYRTTNQLIWNTVGEWEYDDTNYTNFAIATTDINSGQGDYSVPSTTQKIERVEYIDSAGSKRKLKQLDKSSYDGSLEDLSDQTGEPEYYDPQGYSIILYPTPAKDVEEGLKLFYSRDISKFTTADTTKEPGFVEDFHRLISIGSALDFSIATNNGKKTQLKELLAEYQDRLEKFYGSRNRDEKPKFKKNNINYK